MIAKRLVLALAIGANCSMVFAQSTGIFGAESAAGFQLQAATELSEVPAQQASTVPADAPLRIVDDSFFGSGLFQGRFAQQSFTGFNPDYLIGVGDFIDVKIWGAIDLFLRLSVDTQGNIFVPKLGPIKVQNVRNGDLNFVVQREVKRVYRDDVGVYATLASSEPVKVFVTGNVMEPGLYGAYSSDSILHFIDRAGGIDTQTGSFLDIAILRNGKAIRRVNLYDFLLKGFLPLQQFHDGDTIIIGPRKSTARVKGLVNKPLSFEFDNTIPVRDLLEMAGLDAKATHIQLLRNQSEMRSAEVMALVDPALSALDVVSGDVVLVFADRKPSSIVTHVDGEFQGLGQQVLPYDATLRDLLDRVQPTELSNFDGIQLFRESVAERQTEVLQSMLQKLEGAVLSARSGTREEAELRSREAELILKFVERAKKIRAEGRVVLQRGTDPASISLEDQDTLKIPRRTNTIAVQGEVFFPNSFAWEEGKGVSYYLERSGGVTHRGDSSRIFVVRPNGEMEEAKTGLFTSTTLGPGDEIMVMPQIDSKEFQFSKDLVQIIYQLALSAGVVLAL